MNISSWDSERWDKMLSDEYHTGLPYIVAGFSYCDIYGELEYERAWNRHEIKLMNWEEKNKCKRYPAIIITAQGVSLSDKL